MLPPITTASSADVPFGNLPAQQVSGSSVSTIEKIAPKQETPTSVASLFARANLSSLSREIQFSQNVTVLADAIGRMLNLPKLGGETATGYVKRLTAAIDALPQQQRISLEAKISQLLPGLTLSLLVATIKNPTGPQAARLALLVETAPHRGSDLAAKAVATAYRQNIGAENRPVPTSQAPAGKLQSATVVSQVTASTNIPSAAKAGAVVGQPSLQANTIGPASPNQASASVNQTAQLTARTDNIRSSPILNLLQEKIRVFDSSAKPVSPPSALSHSLPANASGKSEYAVPLVTDRRDTILKTIVSETPLSRNLAKLPLATLHPIGSQRVDLGPHAKDPATKTTAPAAARLASAPNEAPNAFNPIAALITAISTASLPQQASAGQSFFASLLGMVKASGKSSHDMLAEKAYEPIDNLDELTAKLSKLPVHEVQSRLLDVLRQLPVDHPQIQALLLAIVRNEQAAAQTYGLYPPAPDDFEPEDEGRGFWGASSQGEDSSQENEEQQADGGNTGDEPQAHDLPDDDDFIETEQQAESYYLKMSTFN